MGFTDIMLFTILSCTSVLGYGILLIEKDIEELKELLKKYKLK